MKSNNQIFIYRRLKIYPNYVDKSVFSEPFFAYEIIVDVKKAKGNGILKPSVQFLQVTPDTYAIWINSKSFQSVWTALAPTTNLKGYLAKESSSKKSYPIHVSDFHINGELEVCVKLNYQLCHMATKRPNFVTETSNVLESTKVRSADDDDYDYINSDDEMIDDSKMFQSITADSIALNLGHRNVATKAAELSQAVMNQSRATPIVKVLNEKIAKKVKETNELLAKVIFTVFEETIDDLICLKNLPHDEKEKLGNSLAECVNFDNFLELYVFADILCFDVLMAAVDSFLGDKNYRTIVMSNSYKNLNSYPEIYKNIFLFKFSP